jgi:hypothetical protein
MDGRPWPPPPYVQYLALEGRAAEAEAMARAGLAASRPDVAVADEDWLSGLRFSIALAALAQGRMAEYTRTMAMLDLDPGPAGDAIRRQWTAAIGGDLRRLRLETEELDRLGGFHDFDRGLAAALNAAEAGDSTLAGSIARRVLAAERPLPHGYEPLLGALVAWSEGALDLAERELEVIAGDPHLSVRYLGLLLLGQLAGARGDCGRAIAVLEVARKLPWAAAFLRERCGTHAIELDALAACYEKTGDLARARERNDELLRRWARADPDLPRLAEAKARKARLEAR